MKYYFEAFRKYAVFSGRASRSEYWFFFLFDILAIFIAAFISGVIAELTGAAPDASPWLLILYLLAAMVPTWALLVRRVHDTGLSGWWALIALVPLIGSLFVLAAGIQDGEPGTNRFGPNPKGVNPAAALAQSDATTPSSMQN